MESSKEIRQRLRLRFRKDDYDRHVISTLEIYRLHGKRTKSLTRLDFCGAREMSMFVLVHI